MQVTEISAIERVYREAGERLWWALFAYTGDREIARDSAAEAFALALSTPDTIRDPAAWIWRVGFRVATAYLREPKFAPRDPNASYELDDGAADVTIALKKLPTKQRATFILFYLDDRPTAEIAELLGMAPATVSVHLHRARRKLRAILGDENA